MSTQELEPTPTPLEFLQAVYCNEAVPLATRLRAAIEAAPYVHPRLAVTAVIAGGDMAERLERAIERSNTVRVIEHEPAEPKPLPPVGPSPTPIDAPFSSPRRRG